MEDVQLVLENNINMDTIFKKILFKTAFCCMICDGNIDDNEIAELKKMNTETTYFGNIDLSDDLELLLLDFKQKNVKVINELFNELRELKLNPIQELLLLEVVLRMIYADKRIDDNERRFIRLLRGRLSVYDEILRDRFGNEELLFDNSNKTEIIDSEIDRFSSIKLPSLTELSKLDDFHL